MDQSWTLRGSDPYQGRNLVHNRDSLLKHSRQVVCILASVTKYYNSLPASAMNQKQGLQFTSRVHVYDT